MLEYYYCNTLVLRAKHSCSPCCCYRISGSFYGRYSSFFPPLRSGDNALGKQYYDCSPTDSSEQRSSGLLPGNTAQPCFPSDLCSDALFLFAATTLFALSLRNNRDAPIPTCPSCPAFLITIPMLATVFFCCAPFIGHTMSSIFGM